MKRYGVALVVFLFLVINSTIVAPMALILSNTHTMIQDTPLMYTQYENNEATNISPIKKISSMGINQQRSSTDSEWPMFRHDPFHSGSSTDTAPDTNDLRWKTTIGKTESSPAISEGRIYIASITSSTYSTLYCLDAFNGSTFWHVGIPSTVVSSPAVANGFVYIGSKDKNLYCYSIDTGAQQWKYTTKGEIRSSPTVTDNKVFFASSSGVVYCLNATSGTLIWSKDLLSIIKSSPASSEIGIFIATSNGFIYSLHPQTGAIQWQYKIHEEHSAGYLTSSPMIHDDMVFIGSLNNKIYCINATTGLKNWEYLTGNMIFSSPAYSNGYIFFSSTDERFYCLNASTGDIRWSYHTNDGSAYCSPAVAEGKVYVGVWDGTIYCFDIDTGQKIWDYDTREYCIGSPALSSGKLYIGCFKHASYTGSFYCIGETNKPPVSSFSLSAQETLTFQTTYGNDTSYDSDGYITEWYWDFGDGNTSVERNITYQYHDDGIYIIHLTVTDNEGLTNSSQKQILILNRPPVANDDIVVVLKNISVQIDVLSNDNDIDGSIDPSSVVLAAFPTHGNVLVNHTNGQILYIPVPGFTGTDIFMYRILDDDGALSNTAMVTLFIQESMIPVGNDDSYQIQEDHVLYVPSPGVLENDDDPDNNPNILTAILLTNCTHGTIQMHTNGSFRYIPDHDFFGVDGFTYIAFDGIYSSEETQVFITVIPVNDPPIAYNDTITMQKGTSVEIDVIANDRDVDGNILFSTIDIVSNVTHGTLGIDYAKELIRYTPFETYIGTDSFSYTVKDNNGAVSNSAKVSISIEGMIPPLSSFRYTPERPVVGEDVRFQDRSSDTGGSIVNWSWDFGDGTKSYDQHPLHVFNAIGTYTVTLRVIDNDGMNDSSNKSITIYESNKAPVADFIFSPDPAFVDQTVSFIDRSKDDDGYIRSWNWLFGDGTSSNQQHPQHTYTKSGTYEIQLSVIDDDGAIHSTRKTIQIESDIPIRPSVKILSPLDGSSVYGNVTISGIAISIDAPIQIVELEINELGWFTVLGTTTWTYEWDTTKLSSGFYNIKARSYDGTNYSTIDTVTIKVVKDTSGIDDGSTDSTNQKTLEKDDAIVSAIFLFSFIMILGVILSLLMILYVLKI